MTSAWQSCQGDYKPPEVFVRNGATVITRNIHLVEDGVWQWEEYAMLTEDYETIQAVAASNSPYVETKKAYYGETEKVFYDVPIGNVTVFIGGYNGSFAANRVENRLIVSFDTLEEETDVTITIQ